MSPFVPRPNSRTARLIAVFILLLALASVIVVRHVRPAAMAVSQDILQPGDIIFVDLYEGWCHLCYWDHLAIYIGGESDADGHRGPGVVEATYNLGITFTRLSTFLTRDSPAEMSVRRLKDVPGRQETVQKAIDYALDQVGKPFNFTAIATIPLKMNEDKLHCVELVWRAYRAAGIDLDANDGPFLYPDDLYYSPALEPV